MLLSLCDVTRGLFSQLANRRQAHFSGTALQVVPQLVEERLHPARHHAFVPARRQRADWRLLQQFGNRRKPIEQIGRFDSHDASPLNEEERDLLWRIRGRSPAATFRTEQGWPLIRDPRSEIRNDYG